MRMLDPSWGFGYWFKILFLPLFSSCDPGRDVGFCGRWLLHTLKGLYTSNMLHKPLNSVKAWQTL